MVGGLSIIWGTGARSGVKREALGDNAHVPLKGFRKKGKESKLLLPVVPQGLFAT